MTPHNRTKRATPSARRATVQDLHREVANLQDQVRLTEERLQPRVARLVTAGDTVLGELSKRLYALENPSQIAHPANPSPNAATSAPKPSQETDPTGKAPQTPGAKLDAGKTPVIRGCLGYFPRALLAVAHVSQAGAAKYSWGGWRSVEGGVARYGDALGRHLLAEASGEKLDPDTGCLHAAQVAWNALARLELMLEGK